MIFQSALQSVIPAQAGIHRRSYKSHWIPACAGTKKFSSMPALTQRRSITQEWFMARKTVEIELVKNEASYQRALRRLAHFFDHPPKAGSSDEAEFELLMMMAERYEGEHHAVRAPDPVAAIEFAIEQRGLTPREIQAIFGSRQRVHD